MSPRCRPVVVETASRLVPVASRMTTPLALVPQRAFSVAIAPLSLSGLSFRRQVMQLEGCERAVRPGKKRQLTRRTRAPPRPEAP